METKNEQLREDLDLFLAGIREEPLRTATLAVIGIVADKCYGDKYDGPSMLAGASVALDYVFKSVSDFWSPLMMRLIRSS